MDDDLSIKLEDWKMAKDRIKHFDDVIMRTRIQGLPIGTGLQAVAFITSNSIGRVQWDVSGYFSIPVFSLIMFASVLYLIPVFLFDIVHFRLLILSVRHAREIENQSCFKDKLQITNKLTSPKLTRLHEFAGYGIYVIVIGSGILFGLFGSSFIDSLIANQGMQT